MRNVGSSPTNQQSDRDSRVCHNVKCFVVLRENIPFSERDIE